MKTELIRNHIDAIDVLQSVDVRLIFDRDCDSRAQFVRLHCNCNELKLACDLMAVGEQIVVGDKYPRKEACGPLANAVRRINETIRKEFEPLIQQHLIAIESLSKI